MSSIRCLMAAFAGVLIFLPTEAFAQNTTPDYEELRLEGVFPSGGRQGETVVVEFFGNRCNFTGAKSILIDGPPGITVRELKLISPRQLNATLAIAKDAAPGRRCVRIHSERAGLTNMAYFTVGRLPDAIEKEPNNDVGSAQPIALPSVVHGRVNPKADVDCYSFEAKAGQRIAVAVLAHHFDAHGQGADYGFVDARLQILNASGKIIAEAGDTLGLDPQLDFVAPATERYTARVSLEGNAGFSQAVYRLMLTDGPMPTSMFPPGGKRGEAVEFELQGPGVATGTRRKFIVGRDEFPLEHRLDDSPNAADLELSFLRGDLPERNEAEPNGKPQEATLLDVPMTANGRFDHPNDVDCYRVRLTAEQAIVIETTAQRFLRSPVDTLVEVLDVSGKKLAENDDGFPIDNICLHDYRTMDSRLVFTAPAAGEYIVRVRDQSGNSGRVPCIA